MDEVLELAGRGVETRFNVDRFSAQTLALVYQRLATETEPEEGPIRPLAASCCIVSPGFQIAEVKP